MKIVRQLDEHLWRKFVDNHPQGQIFHTPEMFQVFAQAQGHCPTLWATVDDEGETLALLLPVQITLKNGLLHRLTTRAIVYGGILCAPGPKGAKALVLLLETYTRDVDGAPLFTELRNLSNTVAIQPILREHGFALQDHLNYLIDLDRPVETIMQDMSKSARKKIRRKLGQDELVVEEITQREQLSTWYSVLQQTYHRAQIPLADRSLFEATFDVLYPRGMVKFLVARTDQAHAAVSVELLYKKENIYAWYGGTDRTYRHFYPTELLTWHIIRWGAEQGYKLYDFGGAGKPDEEYGVRDFKAKFGGQLVNLGRHVYVHAPVTLAFSRIGYQVYRKTKQYLPTRKKTSPTAREQSHVP